MQQRINKMLTIKCKYCGKYQKPNMEIESTPMRMQAYRNYYCSECHAKLRVISEDSTLLNFFGGIFPAPLLLVLSAIEMFDSLLFRCKKFFRKR